jgi:hypothetical protein
VPPFHPSANSFIELAELTGEKMIGGGNNHQVIVTRQ